MEHRLDSDERIMIDSNTDEKLIDLYFTYEFSNHIICLLRDNPVCATVWGFVDSGRLSEQEAMKALYGIGFEV